MPDTVRLERENDILVVTIDRPARRNAVDRDTALALYDAFTQFDGDPELSVAVLTGAGGVFCAGADLQAVARGTGNITRVDGDLGPMGPTRLQLSKPVVAAVEGYAVAGGLELALWCDLRVAAETAAFGVFCRRFGVPLIDGGTLRLPRLIGQSRAMDLILTGREVGAREAEVMGLANRVVPEGEARAAAIALAQQLAAFPQRCLRSDRRSAMDQWSLPETEALRHEMSLGLSTIQSGETGDGAAAFVRGQGRHGTF